MTEFFFLKDAEGESGQACHYLPAVLVSLKALCLLTSLSNSKQMTQPSLSSSHRNVDDKT